MSFDSIPITAIFATTTLLVLIALEAGYRLGGRSLRRGGSKSDVPGAMVGATMGLVAFMIAFTFNGAAGRHDSRRSLLIEDVNAIRTAWLRTDFLAEPERTNIRRLIVRYVDLRVDVGEGKVDVATMLANSMVLHDQMWAIATDAGRKDPGSVMNGLLAASLNRVFDSQLRRVTVGDRARVAPTVWLTLYALTVLGMLMIGIQAGLGGVRQSGMAVVMALAFAIVLALIADLDRPTAGYVNVSQQPMKELQAELRRSAGLSVDAAPSDRGANTDSPPQR